MDLESVSVHKHEEKELGQCPAILTSHLVNSPDNFDILLHKVALCFRKAADFVNGLCKVQRKGNWNELVFDAIDAKLSGVVLQNMK